MRWPRTLFARLTLVIASVAFVFQVFAVTAIILFVLVPQGQRAGEQFAALLVDKAREWARQPESQRSAHAMHTWEQHAIRIRQDNQPGERLTKFLPYYYFLESSVQKRTGQAASLYSSRDPDGKALVWVDVPTTQGMVAVGFDYAEHPKFPRLATAAALILALGAIAALAVSAFLARYLTRTLGNLSRAVDHMGRGRQPEPLPEDGPEEFVRCIRSFNRMTVQIQDLLAGRTTLLAGISHDLRTPLARMRLALAMLADKHDPTLVNQLLSDVDDMNALIDRCLEVGHGFEEAQSVVDMEAFMAGIVADSGLSADTAYVVSGTPCQLFARPLALRRIMSNLVENAVKYAGKAGIELEVDCDAAEIRVLDRGPGIPPERLEAVFRPFYRLEPSRCQATGGYGLGLAITRQLAEANGWRIVLENRPGGGLSARLRLNFAQRGAAALVSLGRILFELSLQGAAVHF